MTFEYSLVHGVNDTEEDAKELSALLSHKNCHINLIPVNPIKERDFERPTREAAEKFNFNKAIFPGTQGGPLEHVIAGKAVCFGEALKPEFKAYQHQVAANAKALAQALKNEGFKLLTDGTDNHLMLVDLRGMEVSGKELQNRCDEVYITLNKNTVPNDPRSPFVTSGVRIGTPAITTRGLKEEDMPKIARCIWLAATDFENKADYIRSEVTKICERYPIYQ